jgi:hypothetical protein
MSPVGTFETCRPAVTMSALGGKADLAFSGGDVRVGPEADIASRRRNPVAYPFWLAVPP